MSVLTGVQLRRRRVLRTPLVVAGGLLLVVAGAGLTWLVRPPAPREDLQ